MNANVLYLYQSSILLAAFILTVNALFLLGLRRCYWSKPRCSFTLKSSTTPHVRRNVYIALALPCHFLGGITALVYGIDPGSFHHWIPLAVSTFLRMISVFLCVLPYDLLVLSLTRTVSIIMAQTIHRTYIKIGIVVLVYSHFLPKIET